MMIMDDSEKIVGMKKEVSHFDVRSGVPMNKYNVWAVGGKADSLYVPANVEELAEFMSQLSPAEPLTWLGLGSNVLVRDGGIRGTVINTAKLNDIYIEDGNNVLAAAGVPCPKLAKFCAKHDLVGGEFFCGIPGTLGGALAMNAGAFGGQTYEVVEQAQLIHRDGSSGWYRAEYFNPTYRHVEIPVGAGFAQAKLQFEKGDGDKSLEKIKALLKKRSDTQPMGQRSCGSVFKNPEHNSAGRLIEECGMKGVRIGDAMVSPKHANFIINTGSARASDLESLIFQVQHQVYKQTDVWLTPEVHFLGDYCQGERR